MSELLIAVAVAWVYLTLVRFVDLNEREPVWALALVFLFGALGACLADLVVGSERLAVPVWGGALAVETTKLLALGAGILVFNGMCRIRGWSEFSDLLDGLVYGIAVGLGYSTGETLLRELHTASFTSVHLFQTPLQQIVRAAASGLSHGVFGGMVGLGCGLALEARGRIARSAAPLLGLAGAVTLDAAFRVLAHGNALGGRSGLYRAWLAVLLPLLCFIAIGLFALLAERRAIEAQLATEAEGGLVAPGELALLRTFWRRQLRYLGLLARGRLGASLHLAGLHNRLVQLALLKRKLVVEPEPIRRQRFERQAELLRAAIWKAGPVALLLFVLLGAVCTDPPEPTVPESVAVPLPVPPPSLPSDPSSEPAPTPTPAPYPTPVQPPTRIPLDSLIQPARRDLDAYWGREMGFGYRSPEDVRPYSVLSVECPAKTHNASWCPPERRIYYDPNWLDSFRSEAGDFAPVFVLSHEWGHLVQDLRGDLSPQVGFWGIQLELQADCLAGLWSRDAGRRGFVKPGEDDHAVLALRRLRDTVDYPWFASGAHGDAGQRINAFLEGTEGRVCGGADFWRRVHLDPQASQQTTTPSSGPLLTTLACRMGRFQRTEVHPWPAGLSPVVTDAVQATFVSDDGVTVYHFAVVLVSDPAAQQRLDGYVASVLKEGFRVVQEGQVVDRVDNKPLGIWKQLTGRHEIVILRNRQRVTLWEGPSGAPSELLRSTASHDCSSTP